MKRTWKHREIGADRIREALRTARSMTAAARELGVDRSTLHRWIEADPALAEVRRKKADAAAQATELGRALSPDEWAAAIERAYELTETEAVLLELGRQALEIANDKGASSAERLSAMGRFQRLVHDLNLEAPTKEERHGKTQGSTAHIYRIK